MSPGSHSALALMDSNFQALTDRVIAACREKTGPLSDALNLCFQSQFALTAADTKEFIATSLESVGPGLLMSFAVSGQVLLFAIPAALPLPDWVQCPEKKGQSQLNALAWEWSLNCIPEDAYVEASDTVFVADLNEAILKCQPTAGALCLPFAVSSAGEIAADEPSPQIWLVGPCEQPPVTTAGGAMPHEPAAEKPQTTADIGGAPPGPTEMPEQDLTADDFGLPRDSARLRRLLKLPVRVIVTLADKKVPLGRLLTIGPGSIVTFDKSCEDLLDLYINNRLYCRGEAVKIGEKFGLKINEVGSVVERVSALLEPPA